MDIGFMKTSEKDWGIISWIPYSPISIPSN